MLPPIYLSPLYNPLLFPLREGAYLIKKFTTYKVAEHYAVLVVGKYLRDLGYDERYPLVFHLTDKGLEINWFDQFSDWQYVPASITQNDLSKIIRFKIALSNTNYNLFSNNCEQFARYVVEGYKQSTQLQNAVGFTLLASVGVAILANWNNDN